MVLERVGKPLELRERERPQPGNGQIQVEVTACGVCRTDLHLVDGDLPEARLPIVPGHQIVGRVKQVGTGVDGFETGDRVGIPWLGWTCGECGHCLAERENLCDRARFTGHDLDGGYAEYAVADARYTFGLADDFGDLEAAPLLCGGLIGYRALRLAGEFDSIGFYGFGSAAHLLAQVVVTRGQRLFAFTRAGDSSSQEFARALGATWAGDSNQPPPQPLDAAIIFAPVGALVPAALGAVRKGGTVVCAGIHMSDIPSFPYATLWGERTVRSVANLTRRDAEEFLELAPRVPISANVRAYPLAEANRALDDLREGRVEGSVVLTVS
jgi:propanol-preferring alcohol dehydrogenase